jgi:hypothetical protein
MDVDEEIKVKMRSHIKEFTEDLVNITGIERYTAKAYL